MYDIIVIGAGPAGCMAAKRIAETGYKVLLAERMEFPREKSCSGILIKKSIQMVEEEFGKVPESVFSHPQINNGIILTNEDNQVFKFESKGYNIWRNTFDHWMACEAENAGAELRTFATALSCKEEDDLVVVKFKNNIEKANAVIVCDGAASRIRRGLMNVSPDYIFTYQTFSRGTIDLDSQFFHAFLDPRLSQYDAWFNVKDDFLIMGVVVKNPSLMEMYHSRFVSFLKSHYNAHIESIVKTEVGIMPYITPEFSFYLGKGRVLFAGEAANLLNPMGEGISSALASGYLAAEAIKFYENPDFMSDSYKNGLKSEIDYMIRQWKFLGGISKKFNIKEQ